MGVLATVPTKNQRRLLLRRKLGGTAPENSNGYEPYGRGSAFVFIMSPFFRSGLHRAGLTRQSLVLSLPYRGPELKPRVTPVARRVGRRLPRRLSLRKTRPQSSLWPAICRGVDAASFRKMEGPAAPS